MAAWPDGRRHRKTYAKGRLDGGFGRRKARQKRFAGSNDDRRLVFGGECVDGILPGEKGDLYDLYPETAFSESMVRGTRLLRNILLGVSVLIFLVVSWLVIVVLRSTLYRIRDSEGTFRAAFHQAAVGMLQIPTVASSKPMRP